MIHIESITLIGAGSRLPRYTAPDGTPHALVRLSNRPHPVRVWGVRSVLDCLDQLRTGKWGAVDVDTFEQTIRNPPPCHTPTHP
jgi:hypothetical protein